ncbi:MAG: peptidylprolyl isomerase [Pseudomonadota bacterium]
MPNWILKLARDPLTAFFAASGLIFVVYAILEARNSDPVYLSADIRAGLIENFTALQGRPPTKEEIANLENDFIAEELLFRDALDQGLHMTNAKARSLVIDDLRGQIGGRPDQPNEADLLDFYVDHPNLYRTEPAFSFRHVYFQTEPEDASALLQQLQAGEDIPGDSYWQGAEFPNFGVSVVRGMFGQPFIEALNAAPLNAWTGPLPSPRGWHFVFLSERHPPSLAPFARVRSQVEGDYMRAAVQGAVDEYVEALKDTYDVEIDRD